MNGEGLGRDCTAGAFINTVHLGNTKFIKHEIKSSPGENDAIKRRSKHETYEAAASGTQRMVFRCVIRKK